MNLVKKIFKYLLWASLLIFLVLYGLFRFGMNFSMNEEELADYFAAAPMQPQFRTLMVEDRPIHYAEIGKDSLPLIIFIHGSPGTWDNFSAFMKDSSLLARARMISVDRLGYGKSDPRPEPSLMMHSKSIQPLIDSVPSDVPVFVVGHSMGGPVAVQVAMDNPTRLCGMLLLAGLSDPALEERLWIQKPLRSPALRWLLPPDMDISNREIVPLKDELARMMSDWKKIQCETIIVQGTQDILVETENASFAQHMLTNAPSRIVYLPGENHFIPWSQKDLTIQLIHELLDCGKEKEMIAYGK